LGAISKNKSLSQLITKQRSNNNMSFMLDNVKNAVVYGKDKEITQHVEEALNNNIPPKIIIDEGLISGMGIIGARFKNREVFVPDILIAARAMHLGMSILKPMINQGLDENSMS
jgi:5-methyltetrahydrofolate--homocysteine methyltransferase